VESILIHLGEHRRQLGHLVTERFGILSVEVVATAPALRRLAHDDLAELFRRHQGTDTTAVTGLPSPFLPRGGSRRAPLHRRAIRGRWLGGVGGVGVEPFLQGSDPLLQSAHQSQDGRLSLRCERIPDLLWKRRAIRHDDVVINSAIKGKNGP
jgi:hypothetical protein